MLVARNVTSIFFALIGAYIASTDAVHSDALGSQWQVLMSDAYDKKCKALMALGRHSSALHFARLSTVLDAGKLSQLTVDLSLGI